MPEGPDSPNARNDLVAAATFYARVGGRRLAQRFVRAVDAARRRIVANAELGSARYAEELRMPGLRTMPVDGFPYLVFYRAVDRRIEVLRVLHLRRDIPAEFDGDAGSTR